MARRKKGEGAAAGGPATGDGSGDRAPGRLVRRHLRFGWAALLGFLALGLVLEGLHGLKIGWYLDVANATRRLMWTLGHAHGTLLALVNVAYALTLPRLPAAASPAGSGWLVAGSLMMPVGFLVGGAVTYGGDPNPGITLAAVGGLVLLVAIGMIVRAIFHGL
jgi:hypothetical protein